MGNERRAQYQCMHCGALHWIEDPPDIDEDELYIKMKCKHCGKETNHLWVGTEAGDEYLYYDVNADPRYYEYNTK